MACRRAGLEHGLGAVLEGLAVPNFSPFAVPAADMAMEFSIMNVKNLYELGMSIIPDEEHRRAEKNRKFWNTFFTTLWISWTVMTLMRG